MSSVRRTEPRTLAWTLARQMLPALVLTMLVVTGVAVVLGWNALLHAGSGDAHALRTYFRIIFWTGLSEGVSLAACCVVLLRLSRRISRPISSLAEQADALTASGGSASFRTDTPLRELNQLAAAFNRLFAAQETRAREVRDLSSHVLHDIKTPLTRIRNAAELVFHGKDDGREASRRIASSCGLILNLVNMNAEISRTYAGADIAPAGDVDLSALVRNALDLYSSLADEKEISLTCDLPPDSVHFTGHGHRLQGLVANLLDNAVKYTPPHGAVHLVLRQEPAAVLLSVADTGPGIPPEAVPHVFERFYRADPSRHEPGFGLGLALVHAVVTSYRGTVSCDSAPGRGSTFSVSLPVS